jgi:hypothetical protein
LPSPSACCKSIVHKTSHHPSKPSIQHIIHHDTHITPQDSTKTNSPPLSPNRVLLPISLRLLYIHHASLSSNSTSNNNTSIYTSISITITTTLTTHLATMACTLPCLKQFLAMFESGMIGEYSGSGSGMNTMASGAYYGSGSGKGTMRTNRSGSIALVEIARGGHGAVRPAGTSGTTGTAINNRPQAGTRHRPTSSSSEIELVLRPDHAVGDYSVASVSTAAAAADASSFVSDRSGAAMIIKKTQKWEITTGDRW